MKRTCLSLGLLLLLSSCSHLRQSPKAPELHIPASFLNATNSSGKSINSQWWKSFADDTLNEIVQKALLQNLNYQIALKNVEIARAYAKQSEAAHWPLVNFNYNFSRQRSNQAYSINNNSHRIYNLQQIQGSVSYEIDFWNKTHHKVHEAKSHLLAGQADAQIIQISLVSSVLSTYFQLLALNSVLEALQAQRVVIEDILEISQVLVSAQLAGGEVFEQAKAQLEEVEIKIQSSLKDKEAVRCTLAYLLGEYPENFELSNLGKWPSISPQELIPEGLPSQMLEQRPDIKHSYWQLMAFGFNEKQSLAKLLPAFTLTGAYGFSSVQLSNFISGGSQLWILGVGLFQPVFNHGALKSEYERSKLQYEAAALAYQDTVVHAFQEVNKALVSYQSDYEALQSNREISKSAQEILKIAKAQHQAGLLNGAQYLRCYLDYIKSEEQLIIYSYRLVEDIIQVYKALGFSCE